MLLKVDKWSQTEKCSKKSKVAEYEESEFALSESDPNEDKTNQNTGTLTDKSADKHSLTEKQAQVKIEPPVTER